MRKKQIYLDNNATTMMTAATKAEMTRWCNVGNPSSSHETAKITTKMMSSFRRAIAQNCGATTAALQVVFTSGGSESNCAAIKSVIQSATRLWRKKQIPHVVVSSCEHKSVLSFLHCLRAENVAEITEVSPDLSGRIQAADVARCLKTNTVLICVMHANNETGKINDIENVGRLAKKHKISFHCDLVQTFGKKRIDLIGWNITSAAISFHKFGGPPGIGALVMQKSSRFSSDFSPLIFGTQNDGLRGGTENIPDIGASALALAETVSRRAEKNKSIGCVTSLIAECLRARFHCVDYPEWILLKKKPDKVVLFVSESTRRVLSGPSCLPGTLLLSIVRYDKPHVCNGEIKDELEKMGFIVAIGSACNTSSTSASHVLTALELDSAAKRGTLRISLSSTNTMEEAAKFSAALIKIAARFLE